MGQQNDSKIIQFGGAAYQAPAEEQPAQQAQAVQAQQDAQAVQAQAAVQPEVPQQAAQQYVQDSYVQPQPEQTIGQQAYAPQPPVQPQPEQAIGQQAQYVPQQPVQPQPQAPMQGDYAYQVPAYDSSLTEYFEGEKDTAETTGNLGLGLSIAGFLTGFIFLGLPLDLAGVTLGAISARKNPSKKGKGIAAIAIGSVGFLLTLAVYGFAWSSYIQDRNISTTDDEVVATYDWDDVDTGTSSGTASTGSSTAGVQERKHYGIGDTVTVPTRYGDYSFTITGVSETNARNEYADSDPDRVIVIDYEYKNLSYAISWDDYYNDELYFTSSDFSFYDADGRALDDYPLAVSSPHSVTPGHSTSGQMAIGLNNDTNYMELELSDYWYEGPGITVDLNWP